MIITLKRIYCKGTFTLGALQIQTESNKEFLTKKYFCDTLEPHAIDWRREEKVAGKTAIPTGRYRVMMSYSKTYKRRMPFLQNVPHFTGIMIHTGNSVDDTRGCILVGRAVRPRKPEEDLRLRDWRRLCCHSRCRRAWDPEGLQGIRLRDRQGTACQGRNGACEAHPS